MTATIFDTLMYAKRLQTVGVSPEQAEVQAECIAEILDNNVATKKDLKELECRVDRLEKEIKSEMEKLGYKLTIRLGSMMVIAITALTAILKL